MTSPMPPPMPPPGELEYCENKAFTFLGEVFTYEKIKNELEYVKERAKILAEHSLIRGCGGCDPSQDNIGKYIRYIDKWLSKNSVEVIERDFEDVKNIF